MKRTNTKLRYATACMILTAGLAAGCTDGRSPAEYATDLYFHARWQQQQQPLKAQVEPVTIDHRVKFPLGRAVLEAPEREAIHAFLRRSSIEPAEQIEIDGPRNDDGQHDAVTAARLVAVRAELERGGLTAVIPVNPVGFSRVQDDQVGIYVTRILAIAPDCSFPQPSPGQRPDYAWSCATMANMGYMVANPADLQRGRGITPADGEASSASIQRYRAGAVKPLQLESTN
jgi:pilus assembly protein CpaD